MAKFLAKRIFDGKMQLEDVPTSLRAAVETELAKLYAAAGEN